MSKGDDDPIHFEGEDPNAGLAAPGLDMAAAAFLIVLSAAVMIASLRLPVPGELRTAPGLVPFLTAASLMVMAVMLGLSALGRWRRGERMNEADARNLREDGRALALALAVGIYIFALQELAFRIHFAIAGVPFVLSAFEPVTVIALAAIIHAAWRGPLWITVAVSAGWTLVLSVVFQKLFTLPLPGAL